MNTNRLKEMRDELDAMFDSLDNVNTVDGPSARTLYAVKKIEGTTISYREVRDVIGLYISSMNKV